MAEEINTNITIKYEALGVDQTVRQSQRLLYTMNAIRLSWRDLQDVAAGPTVQNVMWTAIQLTRTWTNLYRLIKMTNAEQKKGVAEGVVGQAAGTWTSTTGQTFMASNVSGGATGLGAQGAKGSLLTTIIALASAHPIAAGVVVAAAFAAGVILWKRGDDAQREEWSRRQRETAKAQGLDY